MATERKHDGANKNAMCIFHLKIEQTEYEHNHQSNH